MAKTRVVGSATVKDPHTLLAVVAALAADNIMFSVCPSPVMPGRSLVTVFDAPDGRLDELVKACDEAGWVHFDFDAEGAKGRFSVRPGVNGPSLAVDGRPFGFLDLYPAAQDPPLRPQLILDHPSDEFDTAAKVVFEADGVTVIVDGDAQDHNYGHAAPHPQAIHSDLRDHVFRFTDTAAE